jgi:hypothetical protein
LLDSASSKDIKEASLNVLRVWLKEKNALSGKVQQPPSKAPPPAAARTTTPPAARKPVAVAKTPNKVSTAPPTAAPAPTAKPAMKQQQQAPAARPKTMSSSGSLSSALMSAPAPMVKKKKRPAIVPPAPTRIVPLDAKGEMMASPDEQRDGSVVVDVVNVVLSADDLVARQRKPGRLGAPVVERKPQTAAALAAKMRDERKERVAAQEPQGMELDTDAPPAKAVKRVTFASDDKLVEIRKYTPENPSTMLSTRSALSGVRMLAKMDVQKEKVLKTQKSDETSTKDMAKRMEPQIEWFRPPELKVVYSEDDEPPKQGQESTERLRLKTRDEGRMGRVFNEKNVPPDDPVEAPSEPDYDESRVRQLRAEPEVALPPLVHPLAGLMANPNLSSLIENPMGTFVLPMAMPMMLAPMQQQPMQQQPMPQPRVEPLRRDSNKVGLCNFWNHGKGVCRFGNTCRFIHD